MAAYHLTIYARAIHTTCPASCIAAAYSRCRTSDRLVPVRYQLPCSQPPSCARARFSRPSIAIASPIPWFDRYIPISPKDRTIDREPGRRFVAAEEFPHLPSEIASFSAYAKQRERERGTCAISSVETLRQVCAQLSKLVRDRIPFGLTECPGVRFVRHFISALASWTWIHGGTGSRVAASHRKSLLPRCSALGPVSPQLFLLHVSPNFIAFIATDYGNARIQVCH